MTGNEGGYDFMPINHEDGKCYNGNGVATNMRPCHWFYHRVQQTKNARG
jgi:hypothetical protein